MAQIPTKLIEDDAITNAKIADDQIDSEHYVDASIDGAHLSADAISTVLKDTFLAAGVQIDTFAAAGVDDDVTTVVEAAASVDTERNTVAAGLGILSTGTTPADATGDAIENYKVQIRLSADEEPIDDGTGGEVYGVLSLDTGVWTLSYFKVDQTAFTMPSQNIDFVFAEVFDLDTIPGTALLQAPTFGDISGSAADHNHNSIYYTETELDAGQLDNRYYTETELDAGQLDNRYFTETEIGDAAGEDDGASLVGYDGTVSGLAATTVAAALDEIVADIGAVADPQEGIEDDMTPTAQNTLPALSATPAGEVALYVAGVKQRLGAGLDYTVAGTAVTWLQATAGFNLETTDDVRAYYVADA